MSSSNDKFIVNAKEAVALVGISALIGYGAKKAFRKAITSDPSASLMNAAEWTGVMIGAIYARDYLIEQKIIPT